MSAPRKCDGIAPRQRKAVPAVRRSVRFELRPSLYSKLVRLAAIDALGRPEPLVSVVERLIASAPEPLLHLSH